MTLANRAAVARERSRLIGLAALFGELRQLTTADGSVIADSRRAVAADDTGGRDFKKEILSQLDLADFEFSPVSSTQNRLSELALDGHAPYYTNLQIIYRKYYKELFELLQAYTLTQAEAKAYMLATYLERLVTHLSDMLDNDGELPSYKQDVQPQNIKDYGL